MPKYRAVVEFRRLSVLEVGHFRDVAAASWKLEVSAWKRVNANNGAWGERKYNYATQKCDESDARQWSPANYDGKWDEGGDMASLT